MASSGSVMKAYIEIWKRRCENDIGSRLCKYADAHEIQIGKNGRPSWRWIVNNAQGSRWIKYIGSLAVGSEIYKLLQWQLVAVHDNRILQKVQSLLQVYINRFPDAIDTALLRDGTEETALIRTDKIVSYPRGKCKKSRAVLYHLIISWRF